MKNNKLDSIITQLVYAAKVSDLDMLKNAERAYLDAKAELVNTVKAQRGMKCSKSS